MLCQGRVTRLLDKLGDRIDEWRIAPLKKGDDFMQFLFILAILVPAVWYYAALGKRISAEEKKAGKDLSDEINPFTGAR